MAESGFITTGHPVQGGSKVLCTFVLPISSMSLGAQNNFNCQIKAEILKFMWVREKNIFGQKLHRCIENKNFTPHPANI
jgi:hypothetical protein